MHTHKDNPARIQPARAERFDPDSQFKITDPGLTRRPGILTHPGSLILAAVAALYTFTLFGIIPQSFFDHLINGFAGRRDLVSGNRGLAIELILGLAALALVYTLVWPFIYYARHKRQRRQKCNRAAIRRV